MAFLQPPIGQTRSRFLQTNWHNNRTAAPSKLDLRPIRHAQKVARPCTILAQAETSASARPPAATSFTWSVGTSRSERLTEAIPEAVRQAVSPFVRQQVPVSLVVVFVKSSFETHPKDEIRRVLPTLRKTLAMLQVLDDQTVIYGCTTSSSFTPDNDPAISLTLAHFPSPSTFHTVRLDADAFSLDWSQSDWHKTVKLPQASQSTNPSAQTYIFSLHHPDFAPHMTDFLSGLDFAFPGVRKIGAEAGLVNPLHEAYVLDADGAYTSGCVLLVVQSPYVQVDASVAQGARGVGPLFEVTSVKDGTEITAIREMGTSGSAIGPPLVLLDMWVNTDVISSEDSRLISKYLLFGTEVKDGEMSVASLAAEAAAAVKAKTEGGGKGTENEKLDRTKPVVMLSRKVLGFDDGERSVQVEGNEVRLGTKAQFQIRDEEAAREELKRLFDRLLLEGSSKAMDGMALMGGVLFVDCERGAALHGNITPDLDRDLFREKFSVPISMMTSAGQVGPLPSGGLLGVAGDCYRLSASALYVTFYGYVGVGNIDVDGDGASDGKRNTGKE